MWCVEHGGAVRCLLTASLDKSEDELGAFVIPWRADGP